MKKMILTLCAIVMAVATTSAQNVETCPFDKVEIDVAARVRVIDGNSYGVNVRSTDKDWAENIKVSVENGVLAISSRNGYNTEDETTVITITCPTDVDVATSHSFEAFEIESEPAAMDVQPEMPRFPFPFMPHHHMPFHMGRPMARI